MSAPADDLQIVSHFPGRLRLRATRFRRDPELAEAAARCLREEPGVVSVTSSTLTGSILAIYDPRAVHADRLVAALQAGGCPPVAADAREHALGTELSTRTYQTFASADDRLFQASRGKVDLRTAVPGALFLGGVATLLFRVRSIAAPQWYDLLFWSYVTFNNLNLVHGRGKQGTSSDEG
jgi:hypothetical protein